jgi:hypothetical protein
VVNTGRPPSRAFIRTCQHPPGSGAVVVDRPRLARFLLPGLSARSRRAFIPRCHHGRGLYHEVSTGGDVAASAGNTGSTMLPMAGGDAF